jgi:hypothetical protein
MFPFISFFETFLYKMPFKLLPAVPQGTDETVEMWLTGFYKYHSVFLMEFSFRIVFNTKCRVLRSQ